MSFFVFDTDDPMMLIHLPPAALEEESKIFDEALVPYNDFLLCLSFSV